MALINYQDYFDFDALNKAIKDAEEANASFGKSVGDVNKRIKLSYDDITKELKDYLAALQSFNVNSKGAVSGIASIAKETDNLKTKQQDQIQVINNLAAANELTTASINDLKTAAKGIVTEFNKVSASTKDEVEYKKQLAAEYQRVTQAAKDQAAALKAASAVVDLAEDSYQRLQAELAAVGKELKALPNAFNPVTGELNKQNKQAVELSQKYNQLNTALKTADAGLGNYQRNVGNYKSAFNGLNVSIAQVSRELPSLTISAQQFFLAISNNLPMVADEIAKARKEVAALRAEGQATPSVFERVISAFLSWQVLLSVGITLMVAYSKEIIDWIGNLFKAKNTIEQVTDAQVAYNEALKENSDRYKDLSLVAQQNSTAELNILKQKIELLKASGATDEQVFAAEEEYNSKRKQFVTEQLTGLKGLQSIPKDLLFNINFAQQGRVVDLGIITKQINDVNLQILNATNDTDKKNLENKKKLLSLELNAKKENYERTEDLLKQYNESEISLLQQQTTKKKRLTDQQYEDAKALLEFEIEKQKAIVDNDNILYTFRNEAAQKSFELVKELIDLELSHRKLSAVAARIAIEKNEIELNKNLEKIFLDRVKRESDIPIQAPSEDDGAKAIAAHKKFVDELTKQIQEAGKAILTTERISELDELAALDDKHAKGLIKEGKYQQEKLEIQKRYNALRIQTQIHELEAELSLVDPNSNRAAELIKQIKELQAQLRGLGTTTKDLSAIFDSFYKNLEALSNISGNAVASFFGDLTHTIQDLAETGTASLQDYAQTAISLGYAVTDELNQASEARIAQMEKDKARELTLAGNNAAAQAAIQERYAKEEAKIKRKEAVNNKINALFQIAINTAVAATKTLGETGIFGVPLLPIIIGLGAAEAAVVLAQPLPQFEKGTQNAPEGYAVVDEKGSELIVDRHGRLKEVGGNGPRITHLDEGDKVFTATKTKEIFRQLEEGKIMHEMQLNARLASSINEGRRAQAVDIMSAALKGTGGMNESMVQRLERAIESIPISQTIFDENGVHERIKRKDSITASRNTYNFGYKSNKN